MTRLTTLPRVALHRIAAQDNVAVAMSPIPKGTEIPLDDGTSVFTLQSIPQGHKVALTALPAGSNVVKYGMVIGHVTEDVEPGSWVHTHNMKTNLSGTVEYEYHPQGAKLPKPSHRRTFMGYRRPDGTVGIRNEVWVVPTVGCVNRIAERIVGRVDPQALAMVDDVFALAHPFGCSQTGADHAQTRKLLASLVRHPNAAGVLVLSLGCENLTHDQFLQELGPYDPQRVRFLTCQDVEDEVAEGARIVEELCEYASQFQREPIPASELVVGLKCGASDGLSGITANPTLGVMSDLLVQQGGSSILTEVPEMFGAEAFLLDRCDSRETFDRACNMLNGFKQYFLDHGTVVYDNPSPGNKQGGITTLEDKSCGCVQKGGTAPIVDVLGYADPVRKHGLSLLCGPGNDLVSTTNLTAAGAHLIVFSTGRGTPFGAPAPTMKVATNTKIASNKGNWIDFDAGCVQTGELSTQQAGELLFEKVLKVASGERTKAEQNGFHDISIWKDGVVL
jgi:altronate hydrolase